MKIFTVIVFFLLLFCVYSCRNAEHKQTQEPGKITHAPVKKPPALDTLLTDLDKLKKDTSMRNASFSYLINDYTTGKPILLTSFNADMSLVPASVLKLVTTAAALEILGEKRLFRTSLQYDGTIENNILKGNLFIVGGGDPTFGSPATFERWTKALKELEVDSITGSIIGDPTIFSPFTIPLTWAWGELLLPYCAPASGLDYNGNLFQATARKARKGKFKPAPEDIVPEIPGLVVENDVEETGVAPAETFLLGYPVDHTISVQGTADKENDFFPYSGVIPDPAVVAANELKKNLALAGIGVGGQAVNIEFADSALISSFQKVRQEIATAYSPSVATLVNLTNINSNNFIAEHLSKQIGLSKFHSGDSESGSKAILQFWKSKGIDMEGMFLFDGCGVSRYNAVTSRQLAGLLYYMTTSPSFSTFYNSLPLAGVSGTLAKYMKGTSAEGNIRAKTGSISRVKSFAGYVRTVSGKRLLFSLLVNNFTCSGPDMVLKLEKIMVDMACIN